MKPLLNNEQIRAWDAFTQEHEPIASIELMERAAQAACQWIMANFSTQHSMAILVGPGNNGGDGLAMASILLQHGYTVSTFIVSLLSSKSDAPEQLNRLNNLYPQSIFPLANFNESMPYPIVIDALLGTGFNKNLEGELKNVVQHINNHQGHVISIDIPSGLHADAKEAPALCVKANYTLSFQTWKQAFLLPETGNYCGKVIILPIGLSPRFIPTDYGPFQLLEEADVCSFYQARSRFAHKGHFGHGLLLAGAPGMLGAALLAARGALRGGIGLLTVRLPEAEATQLALALPEATTEACEPMASMPFSNRYTAWAAGCGLSLQPAAQDALINLLQQVNTPGIIDADALNILALNKNWWQHVPQGSLLTPHPGEFDRLFGTSNNHAERIEKARDAAQKTGHYILLKGAYSLLAEPNGQATFNINGTPALAKGGSGDVLTGLLLALFAQYRNMRTAGLMGMYMHARAAELATQKIATESLLAHETADAFSAVFNELAHYKTAKG